MNTTRPELGAVLDHVCLRSEDPDRLAAFLELAYGMQRERLADAWKCTAPERTLLVQHGRSNTIAYFAYAFDSLARLEAHRLRLVMKLGKQPNPSALFDDSAYAFTDPDGNVVAFGVRPGPMREQPQPLPARLQHIALRTPDVGAMAAFYETLGFVVSDRVQCEEGILRACFLRSDSEHHALALFRASEARFDHLSCETRDANAVIAWADRVASNGLPIHWGIGRHGPGNDIFFMVKDPDGNLLEISAELEVCRAGRPAGTWRHEQRTLNLWGNAIMRS